MKVEKDRAFFKTESAIIFYYDNAASHFHLLKGKNYFSFKYFLVSEVFTVFARNCDVGLSLLRSFKGFSERKQNQFS